MNIRKIIPNINNYVKDDAEYIAPTEKSHIGLIVPEIVIKNGRLKNILRFLPSLLRYLIGSIKEMMRSYKAINKQPADAKKLISEKDIEDMNILFEKLNISVVGYTHVDPSYIFIDKKIMYKNAIVVLMEMKHDIIKTAPSKAVGKEIFRTYYELGVAVNKITEFLISRGYKAHAGPALGGDVNYPLLAQKAGLGMIGKNGMLITPEFGPSVRIAAIYTDIENLSINDNNEHKWINDFCKGCGKCARKCPANAIYMDTQVLDDGTEKHIDYKKCAIPFSNQYGCTVCVKECVFFSNKYEDIKANFIK